MKTYILLISCLIPGIFADDSWDDFTNNLATDLAPLISLFGEQVTKQFLSESLNVLDNYIFALAPLGILTAVVSVIRVCGNSSLRAFIGRAHEGPGEAEHELLSCVSETTAELFNDGGISRVFGRPRILEVVRWEDHVFAPGKIQLSTFRGAVEEGVWKERSAGTSSEQLVEFDIPNLSLNMGIKRRSQFWFYTAAIVGSILQIGIIIFAALTVFVFPQYFRKNGKAVADYAFPLFFTGTALLCVGMFLCAFMIERSSTEYYYYPEMKCKIFWLQQGGQQVGDQVFGSFLGMRERGDSCSVKELPYIKSLRNDNYRNKDAWLLTAVLLTMAGFVCQFVGLRGLHSSIALAQLGSTLLMAVIRTSLRTQRTDLGDNLLSSEERRLTSIKNQELDCFSFRLENAEVFLVSAQLDQLCRQSNCPNPNARKGQGWRIVETRVRLAELTDSCKRERDSAWNDILVRSVAVDLKHAIEDAMDLISLWSNKRVISYKFKILLQSQLANEQDCSVLEEYDIHLRRMRGSMRWEVDAVVLEAVIGLWTWSLVYSNHDVPWEGPFHRIVGQDHQEASEEEALLISHKWIFRNTLPTFVPPDSIPVSRGMFGWHILQETRVLASEILATETHQPLHVMAAQDIYIYFLNSAFRSLSELGGGTGVLPNRTGFVAHSSRIEQLVRCFEANNLGSTEDALLCIVPALRRRGILPEICADSASVRQQVEKYIAAGEWSEAFSLMSWFCNCSEGSEFECSANEMGYLFCQAMVSSESNVRARAFELVSIYIKRGVWRGFSDLYGYRSSGRVLCENKSTFWAAFSRQLGWVAWHIANRLGEQSVVQSLTSQGVGQGSIGEESGDQSPAELIGRNGVINWLTADDDILDRDISGEQEKLSLDWLIDQGHGSLLYWIMIRWTEIGASYPHFLQAMLQLVSQCRSDTAIQIMCRHGADINARSNVDIAGGHTALMQKISEGDERSVLRLLQNGADANAASPSNLMPLTLASSEGYTQIVNMLLQYGAHIDARDHQVYFAALNVAADNNRLATIRLLVEKGAYIDPAGVDGMTPLLSAVSKRNVEIAHFLIEHGANINAQNDAGYTPLMLAIDRNEISIVSELLRRDCDVNAKDRSGMAAFDWARNTGREDCLTLLQSAHLKRPSKEEA